MRYILLNKPYGAISQFTDEGVEGVPTQEKLAQLKGGVPLKGYFALPAKARLIENPALPPRSKPVTPHGPTAWIEIRLREGKKRQIRHMTALWVCRLCGSSGWRLGLSV